MTQRRLVAARTPALAARTMALVGALVLADCSHAQPAGPAPSGPNVRLVSAEDGVVVERVTAQGRVGPPAGSSAKIAFAQPGIVQTLDVRVGERVAAGEPVAELNRAALANAVAQAQADVRAAEANDLGGRVPAAALGSARARLAVAQTRLAGLERGGANAESNRASLLATAAQATLKVQADEQTVDRVNTLYHGGVSALKDLEAATNQLAADRADERSARAKLATVGGDNRAALQQARADVAAARGDESTALAQRGSLGAAVAAAQTRLDAAQIAERNGVLRAPADGIVLAILRRPGESVDATIPVVEIGPADDREVTLTVAASAARQIAVGDQADLTLATAVGKASGRVSAVVPAVDPTSQVATVVVAGVPAGAVPGDAVTASIAVARRRGIVVPASAIVQDPETGDTVVFVAKPGKPGEFDQRKVTVGASEASRTELASGLRAGERIAATGGFELLAPPGG